MSALRQQMIDAMTVRGFSERTHRSYLDAITQLAKHYNRSPDQLSIEELQTYFLYLTKEKKLSAATCRLTLNAIRFLFINVLGRESFTLPIVIPKNPQRIPELLTQEEVSRILAASKNLKHQTFLRVCYGCGLRVSELVNLQVKDIESQSHLLRIQQGKGAKDRLVLLPDSLIYFLRLYWQIYRPYHWLFCSSTLEQAVSIATAQKAFQRAKRKAGIKKVGGIHSLRHAYATHQLAAGMPVHQLQKLMGHNSLQSTMRYVHWVPRYQEGQGADLIAALEVTDERAS